MKATTRALSSRILLVVVCLAVSTPILAMHPSHPLGFRPEHAYQVGLIDQVDLFSGTVSMVLPIGPFRLTYNSNVWRFEPVDEYLEASPDKQQNAGFGWHLGMGEVYSPSHAYNTHDYRWLFVDENGGRHLFYEDLHRGEDDEDPDVHYTRDSSYLRFLEHNNSYVDIEFPDGTTRRYDSVWGGYSSTFRLTKVWSRFASVTSPDISVAYTRDEEAGTELWTVTDRYGRVQKIHLTDEYTWQELTVTKVEIVSVGEASAEYDFNYTTAHAERSEKDDSPNTSNYVTVPYLTSIDLPDGTSYQMEDGGTLLYNKYWSTGDPDDIGGVLEEIILPTYGRIAWTYQEYDFESSDPNEWWRTGTGVATKKTKLADETVDGTWTYKSTQEDDEGYDPERVTEVVYPTGDCTKHYFDERNWITREGWKGWAYGLPFSRRYDASGVTGRHLSTQVWSSNSSGSCSGTKIRSNYVKFRWDGAPDSGTPSTWYATNRVIKATRTVFHDDGDKWVGTELSDFDGLGHHRESVTTGDFWSGSSNDEERTATTNYNRTTGTYAWNTTNTEVAVTDPWVLSVFDYTEVEESEAVGEDDSRIEYTFDMSTGALDCVRVLESGLTRSADDLLTKNVYDSLGLLTEAKRWGGDLQTISTSTSCPSPTAGPEYWVKHTYDDGIRVTTKPYESDGTAGSFFTYDVDLEAYTGLVVTSRDPAGYEVDYLYDVSGRLTKVTPEDGAYLTYTYSNPNGSGTPAKVLVKSLVGVSIKQQSEAWFDDFGRPWKSRRKMPGGTWSERETLRNARGWVKSVSEWGAPTKKTEFLNFDPFGRATTVRPPDGSTHDLLFDFDGVRAVESQAKINLAAGETYVATTREYDAYGRLRKVLENSSGTATDTPTTYDYDVGGRLTKITSGAVALDGVQTREFTYDNRGYLLAEKHPEKGSTGGGWVYNYDFDSAGLVHRNLDGPNDLDFAYDFMGRLTSVKDGNQSDRLVTELLYDSGTGDGTGKLWKTIQHNWLDLPWNAGGEEDVSVMEVYSYQGKGGAVSKRTTWLDMDLDSQSSTETQGFETSYTWTDLGNVSQVKLPKCLHSSCTGTVGAGSTINSSYSEGLLSSIQGVTGTITYHANGAFNTIPHSNNVTDYQVLDTNVKGRPARLYTAGATIEGTTDADWDSDTYTYDGAGNIKAIGSDSFTYDEVSRLVDSTVSGWQEEYTYDIFTNLKSVTTTPPGGSPSTVSFAVSVASNRITGAVSYDAAGNLTAWGSNSYDWDQSNQLKEMNSRWLNVYTAGGERVATIDWQGAVSTREAMFTIRGLGNEVLGSFELSGEDQSGNWTREREYVWGGGRLIASLDDAGTDERHYHLDYLGTPRLLTDSNAYKISDHTYLPYGEEVTTAGADVMKYTGHERDLDTGQDYMHARYYYEHLGRFLSVDPRKGSADHPGSLNRYAYVHGNPALKLDPDGREALVFIIGSGSGGGKLGHAAIYVTTPFGDVGLSYATKTKFDDGLTNFVNDYLSQGREVTMFILETNPLQDLMLAAAILTFKDDNPMFGAYPAYNCSSAVCLVVNVGTDGELRMLAMSPWTLKKKLESGEIASQNGVRIDDAIDVVGKSAEEIRAAERRAVRDAAAQALLDSTFADVMAFHELINPTLYAGAGGQCIVAGAACIPWAF